MKKIFLSCVAVLSLFLFTSTIFAATSPAAYQTTIQSLSEALKARNSAGGPATDIVVINYTDNTIVLSSPTYNNIGTKTSARIKSEIYAGNTQIRLGDYVSGQVFFDQYVGNHATVSVYVSGGRYVVYVTY
jgi:hypothetical protein